MITVFECDNLIDIIFRKRRNSANYLIILAIHLIKLSLNILKEDDNLKEKELKSYTSIKSTYIMKIILCKRKVITIIYRRYKRSCITRILKKIFHFHKIIELTSSNELK